MKVKRSTSLDQSLPVGRAHGLALALSVLLPLLAGCPGSLEGTFPPLNGGGGTGGAGGGGGPACDAPAQVFMTGCFFCHGNGGVPQPPDLATVPIEMNLLAVNSTSPMSTCMGQPFINKANPAASVIIKRVSGTTCGPLMPFGATAPAQATIDCVTSWVMSKSQ